VTLVVTLPTVNVAAFAALHYYVLYKQREEAMRCCRAVDVPSAYFHCAILRATNTRYSLRQWNYFYFAVRIQLRYVTTIELHTPLRAEVICADFSMHDAMDIRFPDQLYKSIRIPLGRKIWREQCPNTTTTFQDSPRLVRCPSALRLFENSPASASQSKRHMVRESVAPNRPTGWLSEGAGCCFASTCSI